MWRSLSPLFLALRASPCGCGATALPVLDTVEVGHVQWAETSEGQRLEIRTLCTDPPVFLVPGFISEDEADSLVNLALEKGDWIESEVDQETNDFRRQLKRGGKAARKLLAEFDFNDDALLSSTELAKFAEDVFTMPNYDHAELVRHVLGEVANPKAKVPIKAAANAHLDDFFSKVLREEPHRSSRFSRQAWLHYDGDLLRSLLDRAQAITQLPPDIMRQTEELQVVHYPRRGHYACHHDTSPDGVDEGAIRIGTLGFFLNNVTQGGETVFPGAFRAESENWGPDEWAKLEASCQRTEACTQLGGLKVVPKKGDGIFWYNVRSWAVDKIRQKRQPAGFGEKAVIWGTVHCAAEVLDGEKWFANLWLHMTAPKARRSGGEL
uniref:Fe2OG dioxygenase domain-containing protein n=1 Tax=Alexandrium andersonii TaxID=327968 RepID=A0A7S2HXV8_9DINO|mmetsp:Transcript_75919/g.169829  ORF Transcript_75919/g.169829 Transcript_75919/m.169829 type:complete len:380 (+) Transcript_75919:183-1322(+)